MLGFQTLSCLHDIPVVRSSTNKLHDVYAKAKETSVLIRLPCNIAETVADTSLKIALTVVNPFVKPLSGPVRVIDDYAAQKIRQIESKYPVINTRTEDVVNTFNEKTEPVRNAMNSVKDTTTSTLQHGKDTVTNAAAATVNKASGVADSVFSFCESHVPGIQRCNSGKSTGLAGLLNSLIATVFQPVQTSVLWLRMLTVFVLLKSKQINDTVLSKLQRRRVLTALPQRVLIFVGSFLQYFIERIVPDDRTLTELKKSKQQNRVSAQTSYFANRSNLRADPSIKTRQSVVVTNQETVITRTNGRHVVSQPPPPNYSNLTDTQELRARLANNDYRSSAYNVDYDEYITDGVANADVAELHAHIKPTDIELLYSRLQNDILPADDDQDVLNADQQQLRARLADEYNTDVGVNNQETILTRTNGRHVVSQPPPNYSNLTDTEELYTRLANNDYRSSAYNVDDDEYITDVVANEDVARLHANIKPTDVEVLYSRLPNDILSAGDDQDALNADQQQLRARLGYE